MTLNNLSSTGRLKGSIARLRSERDSARAEVEQLRALAARQQKVGWPCGCYTCEALLNGKTPDDPAASQGRKRKAK